MAHSKVAKGSKDKDKDKGRERARERARERVRAPRDGANQEDNGRS